MHVTQVAVRLVLAIGLASSFTGEARAAVASQADTPAVRRATVLQRAQHWVDGAVPYNQNRTFEGYRQDCSGFVSMAFGLSKPGPTTSSLPRYSRPIGKADLRPGDILLWSNPPHQGHVVIF